eukprot:9777920-Alexandrium_andersonii.AAC.1
MLQRLSGSAAPRGGWLLWFFLPQVGVGALSTTSVDLVRDEPLPSRARGNSRLAAFVAELPRHPSFHPSIRPLCLSAARHSHLAHMWSLLELGIAPVSEASHLIAVHPSLAPSTWHPSSILHARYQWVGHFESR